LLLGFDAFGGRFDTDAGRKICDSLNDGSAMRIRCDLTYEGTINLYLIEGERTEIAERRISSAEVVE